MSEVTALRAEVWRANQALVRAGLVTLAFGNASGVDRASGVMVIKPSGVPYEALTPSNLAVVAIDDGRVVEGALRPSSDTPTHLALYRRYPEIGGIVHTHSVEVSAWAQAHRAIPALGTTHADHFHGAVPVSRPLTAAEVEGDYELETGRVIIETLEAAHLEPLEMPAVLVASHGPFTWGVTATAAVDHAIALETVAAMATRTRLLAADVAELNETLLERHYRRKHGAAAYYGQPERGQPGR
jgi:L-ribulose-5-phosphate 4-epimerase